MPLTRRNILITGGCGYVGYNIALALSRDPRVTVILYDIHDNESIKFSLPANIKIVLGDICDEERLIEVLKDNCVTGVIHTAGYGLFGTSNLPAFNDITQKVNVDGTRSVLRASEQVKIQALVYTSTLNVAFRGHEIINGKESDIPRSDQGFLDDYSKTKYEAEQMVLAEPSSMRKTILRLGGVFGPNEKAMLPRSITAISSGLLNLAYCLKSDLKIDLVHIDNVVQAHVKALNALLCPGDACQADQQIFSITDGNPTNLRYFLDPLNVALEGRSLNPMITVTHYFSIEKARVILGYQPTLPTDLWPRILSSYGLKKSLKTTRGLFSIKFDVSMPLIASSCFALLFSVCLAVLQTCCL
ncbi:hypothetical protein TCAL_07450 [Tigriopus californicus]|uniref:3-beta hydroxysteroid dehydrogenase/isomerase domain-containing protein n=1 Tax=Tigriopus californicus TaxID=6832 RepID=A0A553N834_TIGCA|nr:hypothetical protein TCAL_07450 [Tigriopus californicus]